MQVAEFGNSFSITKKISYTSLVSIFDYDAVVVNFETGIFSGNNYLHSKVIQRRKQELEDFIRLKNIPLIYISPQSHSFAIEDNQGRKNEFLSEIVPISEIQVTQEIGNKINVNQNTLFTEFLEKHKHVFSYRSYFIKYSGKTIIETPLTKKVLAFFGEDYIFLPHVDSKLIQNEASFFEELLGIFKSYRNKNKFAELPDWVKENFQLPNEMFLKNKIKAASTEIEILIEKKQEAEKALETLESKKYLLTGSGNELEELVRSLFIELDFEVFDVEEGRDDLIVKYKELVAVIEIKGVSKSAAEKHAAQLEKWVSSYFENNGVRPKGILLVNAFKDIPLNHRNENAFPNQMLKYSTQREHCLLTTVQLLGLYYDCLAHPEKKDETINQLFSTIGVMENYSDWKNFISVTE